VVAGDLDPGDAIRFDPMLRLRSARMELRRSVPGDEERQVGMLGSMVEPDASPPQGSIVRQ
jgi:hypothetical protein